MGTRRKTISKRGGKAKKWVRSVRLRYWWRKLRQRRNRRRALAGLAVAVLGLAVIVNGYQAMHAPINPTAYTPLLDTIAKGESNNNYNAYFGNAGNTTVRFTEMSVAEVLQWQQRYVDQGSVSSAVGRYQIIRPTLAGLVKQLGIDPAVRFDEALQDRMAIALLERRGAVAYVEKKLSREQFAANLAKEWAALPRVTGANAAESYYAHDNINRSRISIDEVYKALEALERQAATS